MMKLLISFVACQWYRGIDQGAWRQLPLLSPRLIRPVWHYHDPVIAQFFADRGWKTLEIHKQDK